MGILRTIEGDQLGFWCPGCEEMHVVSAAGWRFDGNYDAPTFGPSVLVTCGHYSPGWPGPSCWCTYNAEHADDPSLFACSRCHSLVSSGQIRFLDDCTHALVGQTVQLAAPPAHAE